MSEARVHRVYLDPLLDRSGVGVEAVLPGENRPGDDDRPDLRDTDTSRGEGSVRLQCRGSGCVSRRVFLWFYKGFRGFW